MLQSFAVTLFLFHDMTKIIQAWYTQEDQVSPLCFGMTEEKIDKEIERDANIKKMLTQMELLRDHMMKNVRTPHGTIGVLSVKGVLPQAFQNLCRIKTGTPRDVRRVPTHAINSEVRIKVRTISMEKSKGNLAKIGPSRVIIGEGG